MQLFNHNSQQANTKIQSKIHGGVNTIKQFNHAGQRVKSADLFKRITSLAFAFLFALSAIIFVTPSMISFADSITIDSDEYSDYTVFLSRCYTAFWHTDDDGNEYIDSTTYDYFTTSDCEYYIIKVISIDDSDTSYNYMLLSIDDSTNILQRASVFDGSTSETTVKYSSWAGGYKKISGGSTYRLTPLLTTYLSNIDGGQIVNVDYDYSCNISSFTVGSSDDYDTLMSYWFGGECVKYDDSTATATTDLSLATLGSDTTSAYTLEKTDDGWNFITPSEAGVNVWWTYEKEVEDSFMRITYKGKYRKTILDVAYVDNTIVIGGEGEDCSVVVDNIDCSNTSYFITYNDLFDLCCSQNGYDGGYVFEIEDMYVQRFAKIDGELYRSRLYHVGFDMLRDENGSGTSSDTVTNRPSSIEQGSLDSTTTSFTTATDDADTTFTTDLDVDTPITELIDIDETSILSVFAWFYNALNSVPTYMGQFPSMIADVLSFLPSQFIVFIGMGISVAIILRFLGR